MGSDTDQTNQVVKYFILEAQEHLEAMEAALPKLQAVIEEYEECNTVYRAAHTIKGGAAMLGFSSIQKVSLGLENSFKYLREHPTKLDGYCHQEFRYGIDQLAGLVQRLAQGNFNNDAEERHVGEAVVRLDALYEKVKHLADGGGDVAATPSTPAPRAPLPANFGAQVMGLLKQMVPLFKGAASGSSRQQLQHYCDQMLVLGTDRPAWQMAIKTVQLAIGHPKAPYAAIAPLVIQDIKKATELTLAGKEAEIALNPNLQKLANAMGGVPAVPAGFPAAPTAPTPTAPTPTAPTPAAPTPAAPPPAANANTLTIPRDPKGAAKAIIGAFPKEQLMELAKYLVMAAKR